MLLSGSRDELGKYIRRLADLMGLRDWRLTLSHEPPDDQDAAAQCNVTHGSKRAVIRVASDWPSWTQEDARHYMTHELLHCHMAPTTWAVFNAKHVVSEGMMDMLSDGHLDALEVGIDGIALAWAETMPMPGLQQREESV